jgi:hypothetical protein
MFHHISIAVDRPLHVAKVLAEVWNGRLFPFPAHPNSYIVLACDIYGTAIEILPAGTELIPGAQEMEFLQNAFTSQYSAVHAAISVPTEQAQIEAIGEREGWRVQLCDRGPFQVIEFWVENKLLLELLPPAIAPQYTEFMHPDNFEAFLAEAIPVPVMA